MLFIGIDPGVAGGIAAVDEQGYVFTAFKMPETRRDLYERLMTFTPYATRGAIEKVNAGVFGHGKGTHRMGVVSAFTFGRNVERCHMALTALGIAYDEVLPVKWQTALGCRTRGDKNVSKARAQQLFPTVKVTHAIADALLIAEYARRAERGSISAPAPKGLFDGEEEERTDEEGGEEVGSGEIEGIIAVEAVARRRRARAPRRAAPPASATGAVARRGRGSR